ncbi:ABC transporter permease [Olivibacter sp. XZL3]|uniref:ABC transporter permease n=1 Tax=Olivibacter sp. XZL3 TaxID=1735116 RepID=UPI001066E3FF|nr:ABC transporter permease [Olivibacter sp. XZL3]
MIKNYLKIAWRNIWKTKAFSIINICGLAVGMTACFLIALYVNFEQSYDRYHQKADRIYRLVCDVKTPTETINANITSGPMAMYAAKDLPEVENYVRILSNSLLIRKDNHKYQESSLFFADSSLFQLFDFPLIAGNPKTALKEPFSIVLSESAAKKYFGKEDPMGKSLLITDDGFNSKVTGIMKDIPENSQFKGDVFISMVTLIKMANFNFDEQWGNFGFTSYLLLKPNTDPSRLTAKFPAFLTNRVGKEMDQMKMHYTLFLEPLKEVYLHSKRGGFVSGNINNVYVFAVVALFILLIACINFINLSTARAVERAKEVGIRKVVGAYRIQITRQFIGESILICLLAFVISLLLCLVLIPYFNFLAGKEISGGIFLHPRYILFLFLLACLIGLLAGIYPALVLSSFKPVTVLKGKFSSNTKGLLLRKTLVVVQFVVSIALIAGTLIVNRQLAYMRNQNLGFNKDRVLILQTNGDAKSRILKDAIVSVPGVLASTVSGAVPGGENPVAYSEIENKQGDMQIANLPVYFVDYNYLPLYKIELAAGRTFSPDFGTDTAQAMILNESAVKLFGYAKPADAIGKKYSQWGSEGKIIDVIKDFHFKSLQSKIEPLSMRYGQGNGGGMVSLKIDGPHMNTALQAIEQKWQEIIPNRPFDYFFADEFFDRQYRAENRFGSLFLNFSVLAIFISCLGLFGLVSYHTTQRYREIGIRKVLGASVSTIVRLLSLDFLRLVAISIFIASPLMWLFMSKWLTDFAYHIDVSWWIFAVAGSIAIAIALLVISSLTIRAAMANPVKSLRNE